MLITISFSKLDLCKGGSFSTNCNLQQRHSANFFSPFRVLYPFVCLFVALLKATYADNLHIALSSQILKSIHFEPLVCFALVPKLSRVSDPGLFVLLLEQWEVCKAKENITILLKGTR